MASKKLPVPASRVEELIASLAEENRKTALAQQKTETAQQKTQTALASLAEEHKKTEEAQQKTEEAQQKTEEAQQKTEEAQQKTEKGMRELQKELGNIGNMQGEIAEDLFRRNLFGLMQNRGIILDSIQHGVKAVNGHEYDLVGVNGSVVVLAEIKNKLRQRDIEKLVEEQIPHFRRDFPDYSEHSLIGAVGSLIVKEEIRRLAESYGLYVLTQKGEDGAELANSPSFKAKVY